MHLSRRLRRFIFGSRIAELEKQLHGARVDLRWLRDQIGWLQASARERNLQLAALHVVWCNGGCKGGVGCRETVDESLVVEAERNVKRLRQWWENRKSRLKPAPKDGKAVS